MEGVAAGFFSAIAAAMKTAAAAASIYPDCVYCPFLSVWKSRFIIHATIAPPPSPIFPLVFFWRSTRGKGVRRRRNFRVSADAPAYESVKSGVTTLCCHATNDEEKGKPNKSIVVASENLTAFCCCALPLYLGNPTDPFHVFILLLACPPLLVSQGRSYRRGEFCLIG